MYKNGKLMNEKLGREVVKTSGGIESQRIWWNFYG